MSTEVLRDRRKTPGASELACMLVALIGKEAFVDVTRNYLAVRLGRHFRTIARYLRELRELGYISTVQIEAPNGKATGLRICLLDSLLPYWQRQEPQQTETGTNLAQQEDSLLKESLKRLPKKPVIALPRYYSRFVRSYEMPYKDKDRS